MLFTRRIDKTLSSEKRLSIAEFLSKPTGPIITIHQCRFSRGPLSVESQSESKSIKS